MRGEERRQRAILMIMEPGDRVPKEHPLRRVKELADAALAQLSPLFDEMYSAIGRPSIPPERLLKGSLLMALYTVRSERMLCEQLDYNVLFRWFLDMAAAEPSFDHSTFSRNRARLLEHDVAREFFTRDRAAELPDWFARPYFADIGTNCARFVTVGSRALLCRGCRPRNTGRRPVSLFVGPPLEGVFQAFFGVQIPSVRPLGFRPEMCLKVALSVQFAHVGQRNREFESTSLRH
jgi:transposase